MTDDPATAYLQNLDFGVFWKLEKSKAGILRWEAGV